MEDELNVAIMSGTQQIDMMNKNGGKGWTQKRALELEKQGLDRLARNRQSPITSATKKSS
uniref:Uncharacterized protein n=1 Tax=Cucumis melo TaxID=3656 RepID=A0A9I9D5R1_CUCME